ncbi:DUF4157 domain-containing protein [Lentzea jiangxiensis]|uniref:eCIS core domain-containing protein n=1 Tax=Lentzea jiangxiensis TaxID=641025 RepID=A0A1H0WTK2_9PSEU|nr:DUF4157 domain-containing protein [Lentzea jiangxiensis]SDP93556.1 protein of unknown function [Lentzea jiangxiensis]
MHKHEHEHEDRACHRAQPPQIPKGAERGTDEVLRLQRLVGNTTTAHLVQSVLDEAGAEQAEVQRASVRDALSGSGKPVPDHVRSEAEARLGVDLSGVRLHTGPAAERSTEEIGARAYTTGRHVVLGRDGNDWKTLLHEFDHVRQQAEGRVEGTDQGNGMRMSDPSDRHEQEAEANATRALRSEPPRHGGGSVSGHHHHGGGMPVQQARIADVQPGLDSAAVTQIMTRLLSMPLVVPVALPGGSGPSTRRQALNVSRATDPRLVDRGDGTGLATITWDQLLRGDVVRMAYSQYDVFLLPHGGDALAAATDDLRETIDSGHFLGDAVLQPFSTALMEWLVRRRSNSSGDVEVVTNRVTTDEGTGAEITVGGRPGWDARANQIVTGYDEDRRHIIAWHTMRGAFRNAFNAALAPGENIRERMRTLLATLGSAATWAELDEAEAASSHGSENGDAASSQSSNVAMTDAPPAAVPSPAGSEMDIDDAEVTSEHGSSQASSTTSEQLRDNLSSTVARVLGMLSNNPYNLWAGDAIANESINRVRQQLAAMMNAYTDDQELIDQVGARAQQGSSTQNQDRRVWTRVRATLDSVAAGDARTFIQSVIDSFDVDIPITGDDERSSTYDSHDAQAGAVRNVLATGLAQEVLTMYDNQLPDDFDSLIDTIDSWLRRFLRPEGLQTSASGGRRTVSLRPQDE